MSPPRAVSHPPARRQLWSVTLCGLLLAACSTPAPLPTLVPTVARDGTPGTAAATPGPGVGASAPAPTPLGGAQAAATPTPVELVVCQTAEPLSLYLYGDDSAARAGVLDAIYDGPIDIVGYQLQPVILEALPSLANGRLKLDTVQVQPGDRVVEASTWQVVQLAEGVHLAQVDGSVVTYTGSAPAQTVQVSAEFKLKPGVLWSDSQQLNAEDSRFSFEAAAYYDTPTSKFVTDRTQSYEVVDALTVRWTGLPGWRDRDAARRFWSPLPRHLFEGVNPSELKNNPDANQRPLGWGPFEIQEWVPGQRLTLTRNPNYFRAAEGLPKVDRLTFRFGLTPPQILDEMRAGRCHIGAQANDFSGLIPQMRDDPESFAPQFAPDAAYEHLDFGILPADDYKRAAGNDLFQDVRVRQAVAFCLDRQGLIDRLLDGVGAVPAVYVPVTHPLYAAEAVTEYPFDAARGRRLLAEAGWRDSDGDGRLDKNGQTLSVMYASGPESSGFRVLLAQLLQSQLRENCGLDLQVKWFEPEALYAPWPAGPLFGRRFDLGSFPWRAGLEPPCELYLSDAIPDDLHPAGANDLGYSDPAFDAACQRALTSFDPAESRAAQAEAQAVFTRDLPSLPLFFHYQVGVARPGVIGYQPDPTTRSDLWNVESIGLAGP